MTTDGNGLTSKNPSERHPVAGKRSNTGCTSRVLFTLCSSSSCVSSVGSVYAVGRLGCRNIEQFHIIDEVGRKNHRGVYCCLMLTASGSTRYDVDSVPNGIQHRSAQVVHIARTFFFHPIVQRFCANTYSKAHALTSNRTLQYFGVTCSSPNTYLPPHQQGATVSKIASKNIVIASNPSLAEFRQQQSPFDVHSP